MKKIFSLLSALCALLILGIAGNAEAGSVFVSGHDPIWHSNFGGNSVGANNLATTAINYARNGSALPFLFVESYDSVPIGNAYEAPFLTSTLGYMATDYVKADITVLNGFSNFRTALNSYSAIVVASDHGGMLSADELLFLNSHAADIIDYINAGGGLAAFGESNAKGMIGTAARFGYLPFLVSSTDYSTPESGNTVTAFGASLGLVNTDVNGNYSHNYFVATGGMIPVDLLNGDPTRPLSLAWSGTIGGGGVGGEAKVPEPSTLLLLGSGLLGFGFFARKRMKG